MATIKGYTDLEQSKKLAEILPLESADMYWKNGVSDKYIQCFTPFVTDEYRSNVDYDYDVPCWSLAALLNVLNTIEGWYPGIDAQVGEEHNWQICMFSYETGSDISTAVANKELVDTCYEVILKLRQLKML